VREGERKRREFRARRAIERIYLHIQTYRLSVCQPIYLLKYTWW